MKLRRRLTVPIIVPMTTMADVAFLLIIFFMLTSTFAKDTGLDITLPRAVTSQTLPKRDVTIWVNHLGQFRVENAWIRPEDLSSVLKREFAQAGSRGVTIRADKGVAYGTIVTVMDTAKLLGADITLAAEIETERSGPGAR